MKEVIITISTTILIVLVMAGCRETSPPASVVSPHPSQSSPPIATTVQISPTLVQLRSTVTLLEVRPVTTTKVHSDNFWWADNKTLHYAPLEPTQWWSYDVQAENTSLLKERPLRPRAPAPETAAHIPQEAVSIGASPSGERTLYLLPLLPSPTPASDIDGEREWLNIPAELWLLQDEEPRLVGTIEDCVKDYLWSESEKAVVVRSWTSAPCKTYAWWVDLESLQVNAMDSEEGEMLEVIDLSPSGRRALVRSRNTGYLYMLDRASSGTRRIRASRWAWGVWLDEQSLIVGENTTSQGARWTYNTLSLYDTQRRERVQLLDHTMMPTQQTQEFAHMTLSPDHQWLAFLAGQDLVGSWGRGELWVARIESRR